MSRHDFHVDGERGLPRVVEVMVAFWALLALLPLLAAISLAVGLSSRGGVLYRQERVGRGGRAFTLYKFRSMRHAHSTTLQVTAAGDPRITPIGRLLRKTKLDELPEFWNVIRGDLALVGPRPEVPRYVDLEDPVWQHVLRARPGLTHPVTLELQNEESLLAAQDSDPDDFYRSTLLPFKLRGYLAYEERRSARTDLNVLFRTARQLLPGGGVTPPTLADLEAHHD